MSMRPGRAKGPWVGTGGGGGGPIGPGLIDRSIDFVGADRILVPLADMQAFTTLRYSDDQGNGNTFPRMAFSAGYSHSYTILSSLPNLGAESWKVKVRVYSYVDGDIGPGEVYEWLVKGKVMPDGNQVPPNFGFPDFSLSTSFNTGHAGGQLIISTFGVSSSMTGEGNALALELTWPGTRPYVDMNLVDLFGVQLIYTNDAVYP